LNIFSKRHNTHLTAGGSSGGAGVGLATELLPTADGNDMSNSFLEKAWLLLPDKFWAEIFG
jgi:hypothetical protein